MTIYYDIYYIIHTLDVVFRRPTSRAIKMIIKYRKTVYSKDKIIFYSQTVPRTLCVQILIYCLVTRLLVTLVSPPFLPRIILFLYYYSNMNFYYFIVVYFKQVLGYVRRVKRLAYRAVNGITRGL